MKSITGRTDGLKASHLQALEKLFRRKKSDALLAPQLAARMTQITHEINRIVGLLIDRHGRVEHVIIGDTKRLYLPDIGRQRAGTTRLRGLRLVRSQPGNPELTREDLTDLRRLRLDLVAVIETTPNGAPGRISWAHLDSSSHEDVLTQKANSLFDLTLEFGRFIELLESELSRQTITQKTTESNVLGVLVYVKTPEDRYAEERIQELHELADTAGMQLVETVIQQRFQLHPRTVVGSDKLEEIELTCLDKGAEILLFGQDLSAAQARAISERTELKVIDRTQLILDIFAQNAMSKGGKIQVELAQLKYTLPRLVAKNTAMSRLMGGLGGRGPGETKLEINRRRARDRITRLEKEISKLSDVRSRLRQKRRTRDVPVVAIVGYTNAGKSTLLNTLTNAQVIAKSQLFATLDPTSRRLRFPENRELVLTDTVGFIHDLPKELTAAFKATLEELEDAHLLIHLVDSSAENAAQKISDVQSILNSLGLNEKPHILVFNKADKLDPQISENLANSYQAIPICALDKASLLPLIETLEQRLWAAQRLQDSITANDTQHREKDRHSSRSRCHT